MPRIEPELQRLQDIKSLPSLIKYLKDDLHWPIESDDVDEVAFDYDPAELGFDSESTAKIEEVRQLRPLTTGQKWGVFWVKFSKKRLPVQMLRRALANLVVKKRASSRSANKAAWHMHDLLFISAYGDDSNRHVTFAHFSGDDDAGKSLPVLKVLGWDEEDTVLHLRDAYKTLLAKLDWEATPTDDPDAWREQWSSAFKVGHREVINTTKELVVELAHLATVIKKSVLTSINAETEKGPWRKLMKAFKDTLIKDLDEEQFADVIAQTVSYGLLTARLSSDGPISLKNLVDMVPSTNPFLKELLQHFLTSAGMKGLFDVDEAGINDVVELLNRANAQAIRNDFGKKTDGEDPVIHFYEHFLGVYNKKLKVERGVFYTPQAVVSYIVRSVHELLQSEFSLEDGLADTSTWADVQKRYKDLKAPDDIKPDIEPFVQILDPATGTATFLIEVIEVIHNTLKSKWDKDRISKADQIKKWNAYVPTHLLPRIYAYELMMAPYAIAHMKIGLKLTETGFTAWDKLGPENRANIFLTNALEPSEIQQRFGIDAIAHEAAAVNAVKSSKNFLVIIGNPPYSKMSGNLSKDAVSLIEPFRSVAGERIVVKAALAHELNLQDDYVKFYGLAFSHLKKTGVSIVAYISNSGFLSSPSLRGMRWNMIKECDRIDLLDLGGRVADRNTSEDENVFEIEQGVAIGSYVRAPIHLAADTVNYSRLTGTKEQKYQDLNACTVINRAKAHVKPSEPFFRFTQTDETAEAELQKWQSLDEIFPVNSGGIITSRDALAIHMDRSELLRNIERFSTCPRGDKSLEEELGYSVKAKWDVEKCKSDLRSSGITSKWIRPVYYRPFDTRNIYYFPELLDTPSRPISEMAYQGRNLIILSPRVKTSSAFCHILVSRTPAETKSCTHDRASQMFPAYLRDPLNPGETTPNINPSFLSKFSTLIRPEKTADNDIAEAIVHYIYAICHSPTYRTRYGNSLREVFPRIPLSQNTELAEKLKRLGKELSLLHLLEFELASNSNATTPNCVTREIEKATWSNETVWIDKKQLFGFKGVPEDVWNFHIGGYQVCEKWLKDRKGRKLTIEDVEHYQKVVVALSETIRLMADIDKVIDEHGGWPGAFQKSK